MELTGGRLGDNRDHAPTMTAAAAAQTIVGGPLTVTGHGRRRQMQARTGVAVLYLLCQQDARLSRLSGKRQKTLETKISYD